MEASELTDTLRLLKPILLARRRQMLAECRAIEELFGLDKNEDLLDPLTERVVERIVGQVLKRELRAPIRT